MNAQQARQLSGHSNLAAYQRYLESNATLTIPEGALPELNSNVDAFYDSFQPAPQSSICLARPAGLEPATSGLEKLDRPLFADSAALQPSVTVQVGLPRRVHRSQRLARNRSPLVTTLLQAAAKRLRIPKLGDKESTDLGLTGEVYLMSVKEVAKTLRVCTATVYNLVEWGELAHVRVSNAIRVVVQASD